MKISTFIDLKVKLISLFFLNENIVLGTLKYLNLGWNKIKVLHESDLHCLHNLSELYLHNNNLSHIQLNTFKNMIKLKKLRLENNPYLIPSLDLLHGLSNTLVELSYNFNQDLKAELDFEKIVHLLIIENNLTNLKKLDLSGSNFEAVNLNLAHLLLTSNNLEYLKCASCSIKYLKFKYELLTTEHRFHSSLDEKVFTDMFKLHACKKKILNNIIEINLENNTISSCQASSYKIRDEIDMDFYLHKNYTYSCETIRINFIRLLMDQVEIKNFECFHSRKQQKVNWQKYNKRKFLTYTNNQDCQYKSSLLNCSNFYDIKEGNLKFKNNKAFSFSKNAFNFLDFLSIILVIFIFI